MKRRGSAPPFPFRGRCSGRRGPRPDDDDEENQDRQEGQNRSDLRQYLTLGCHRQDDTGHDGAKAQQRHEEMHPCQLAMGGGGAAPAGPEEIGGFKLIARIADGVGGKDLRGLVDEAKSKLGSGIAVFIGVDEGKAGVAVGVTDDLTDKVSAVDLVRVAAAEVGGKGGGGRPDMAQAGGPDGDKAEAALDAVRKALAG